MSDSNETTERRDTDLHFHGVVLTVLALLTTVGGIVYSFYLSQIQHRVCVQVTATIRSCDSSKHQYTTVAIAVFAGAVVLGYVLYVISRLCRAAAISSVE